MIYLFTGGSTNHKQGFLQARDILADDGNRANVPDIVVFLTDGIINEGGAPFSVVSIFCIVGRGPLLKLPAWKVGDRGFETHSGLQDSKK